MTHFDILDTAKDNASTICDMARELKKLVGTDDIVFNGMFSIHGERTGFEYSLYRVPEKVLNTVDSA